MRQYHKDGTLPVEPGVIFVFGSNLRGVHGAGAAKVARCLFDAPYGCGQGPMGRAYAIPTKNFRIETLPLAEIRKYVDVFVSYAGAMQENTFFLTRVGCGLAGHKDHEIAPMFAACPDNVNFPEEWK